MTLCIFASFIIFGFWLTYELKKHSEMNTQADQDFWQRESNANAIRKKDLSSLPYISFDYSLLPAEECFTTRGQEVPDCLQTLHALEASNVLIVNLCGKSNTELKFAYGAANLSILSKYDENYEIFSKNLFALSRALYDIGERCKARSLLEVLIDTQTDISGCYKLLCEIYQEMGETSDIETLKEKANGLNSIMKPSILHILDAYSRS